MKAFLHDYRSRSYLQEHPIEECVAQYHRLRGLFGTLTPLRAALNLDVQVTLLAAGSKLKGALVIRFEMDDAPPHKLTLLTTSGVDHAQVPNEEILRVADRAQPLDKGMIEDTAQAAARILAERYVDWALGKAMADAILARRCGNGGRTNNALLALLARVTETSACVRRSRGRKSGDPTV